MSINENGRRLSDSKNPITRTSIRINKELLDTAHTLGLNVSRVCENALGDIVDRLLDSNDRSFFDTWNSSVARGVGFEPTRPLSSHRLSRQAQNQNEDFPKLLSGFESFCEVDLQLTKGTAKDHSSQIRRFAEWLDDRPLTQPMIREYLLSYKERPCTYANRLKSLKVFCRDFLKQPDLVDSFKFPKFPFKPKTVPTKATLQQFYNSLSTPKDRALFLFYCSSGLRRREALGLGLEDVDFKMRMVTPKPYEGQTKSVWVTFFNLETAHNLKEYLTNRRYSSTKLFPIGRAAEERLWFDARAKTGIEITPKMLRDWFCNEMGRLGVQDRYIDAFCGRVPQSVLARNYTDYSPERLKEIYEKADLAVFSEKPSK